MHSATRVTVSTFGAVAALAGIEHGIGELLQGNQAPAGLVIASWPDSEAFQVLNGEPALTIVPNLFVTGVLAIVASLVFLVWATVFIERQHGGLVMILLSLVMLLVGAGFGPPLLGIVLGSAATRLHAPPAGWWARLAGGAQRSLAALWPWSFGAGVIAWLSLFPGSVIVAALFDVDAAGEAMALAVAALTLSAFVLLLLTIVAGRAYDSERQSGPGWAAARG